ncbi:glutaredoxin family protein [Tasmannia lanceolata]|uniref:glutaredoxin family protein n=1 Tax=Tasmannia lanceolata TaxID=3420 RepID=UPI0040640C9D
MGCASSKRVEADIYRPTQRSISLLDIHAMEEPWLVNTKELQLDDEKPTHLPAPILEKLDKFELASDVPHSWTEVSKALEDLKPTFNHIPVAHHPVTILTQHPAQDSPKPAKPPKKSPSFHTLEELDAKLSKKTEPTVPITTLPESNGFKQSKKTAAPIPAISLPASGGSNSLKENIFIVMDRLEREKEGKGARNLDRRIGARGRRDPLAGFPEKCPPGGADAVVLYTTTLRGVRRTFEDCQCARSVIQAYGVPVDERDVALHGGFLEELRELMGEGVSVPRLFVKGRYIGGVDEVVELNETCRLVDVLGTVGFAKGFANECEGCGGARFVLCLECSGSCKVLSEDKKGTVRCAECNENGLVQCPLCH